MVYPSAAQVIHDCQLFQALSADCQQALVGMAQSRHYPAQQVIIRAGDRPPGVFVIASGSAKVFNLSAGGKEHVLHMAHPGQTFLEVAVLGEFVSPAFVQAMTDLQCVLLPADLLQKRLAEDHRLCRELLCSMSRWVRNLIGLLEDIVLRDAVGRVAKVLCNASMDRCGHVDLPGQKKDIASHLNLTSETFSRSLKKLVELDLIVTDRSGGIRILDRQGLCEMADGI